jgi:hypothetical protein
MDAETWLQMEVEVEDQQTLLQPTNNLERRHVELHNTVSCMVPIVHIMDNNADSWHYHLDLPITNVMQPLLLGLTDAKEPSDGMEWKDKA